MPSRKLITLLDDFSGYDLNRLRRYLTSPYFNENEEVIQLFDLIDDRIREKTLHEDQDHATAKKKLWQQIFGKKRYNDTHMRRLLSELIRHALNFLALEQYQTQPVLEQTLLLNILKDQKFDLHFAGAIRQASNYQEKSGLRDASFHFFQHLLEEQQFQKNEKSDKKSEIAEKLALADYHFNCYYISKKLKYLGDALGYREFLSIEAEVELPPGFMEWLRQSKYIEEPIIHAYFLVIQLFLQPEKETFFHELKQVLETCGDIFQKPELKELYIHLVNYCIYKKINIGEVAFFNELFEIFKTSLAKEIWLEKGIIEPQYYKTIISVGLHVNAFDWVENFIRTYTDKLPPADQENAKTYNLAKVYFQQAQYDKVIGQLREVEYQNLNYALGGKLMLLKTYYELNEYLALDSLMDSFRIYLRRNKLISKDVRQQYLNVLRFVKKLSNIRPGDEAAIAKTRQQINDCKALADKSWILQKLQELER